MFTPTNLHRGIPCPRADECRATNCIFEHSKIQNDYLEDASTSEIHVPPLKRRRVANEILSTEGVEIKHQNPKKRRTSIEGRAKGPNSVPSSLHAPVSPPPPSSIDKAKPPKTSENASEKAEVSKNGSRSHLTQSSPRATPVTKPPEALNPRLVVNDPIGHAKRTTFLKYLHGAMVDLNTKARSYKAKDATLRTPTTILEAQDLISMALDEEEHLAREKGGVYANVVKNRIGAYKKMDVADWIERVNSLRKTTDANKQNVQDHPKSKQKPIETGLSPAGEVIVASQLVIPKQESLVKFGYVCTPPTSEEAKEAAAAVEAAWNYEICDRCSARFQVFPNRDDEGRLTSNGPCKHHPRRKIFPTRDKSNSHLAGSGTRDAYYPCCNASVGTEGCTQCDHHVFKAATASRLAAVLPFIMTPSNEKTADSNLPGAVAFDCEMGYTTLGMELIRITAVSWPQGEELLDTLVRPLGIILDLNGIFSGVFPEHFANALPLTEYKSRLQRGQKITEGVLPVVESPSVARDLLCSFLRPETPLIGHAIENDLNAVRLCHPTIIDTVVLFPHPRGLPMRMSLKALASKHLDRKIQIGGDRGHDSKEDALATGDLVRVKVKDKWEQMRRVGWLAVNGAPTNEKSG